MNRSNGIVLDKNIIEKESSKIFKENKFIIGLNKIMQNNDYIDFMNEFGNDWNDIKVIILYQKLYQSIKKQYYNKYNKKIPNKLLIVILVKLFENNKVRKIIMNRFIEYINSEIKDDNIIDLRNNSYNNLLLLN